MQFRALGVWGSLVALVVGAGCITPNIATTGTVTRIDGGVFKACVINLGWTEEETIKECGEPDARLRSGNEDETGCWLYSTRTLNALGLLTAANAMQLSQYVVCFKSGSWKKKNAPTLSRVWAVSKDQPQQAASTPPPVPTVTPAPAVAPDGP